MSEETFDTLVLMFGSGVAGYLLGCFATHLQRFREVDGWRAEVERIRAQRDQARRLVDELKESHPGDTSDYDWRSNA